MEPSTLKQIYAENADKALTENRHQELLASSTQTQDTILSAISALIRYTEGHVTRTEVVNQLESIETPDVKYVVEALQLVDKSVRENKPDNTELVTLMQSMVKELGTLPREVPTFEQKDSVSVSNLGEIEKGNKELLKAINALELSVEAPVVNVEKPDFEPIKSALSNVEKAIKALPKPDKPEKVYSRTVELNEGAVPTFEVNRLITEVFDEWRLVQDTFDDERPITTGMKYYLKTKLVAQLKYTLKDGRIVGAKKVTIK